MKFEPQCKKQADLHREWARVLDMCEGTEARPEDGWKFKGSLHPYYPTLDENSNTTYYEFSIGIVEGTHVFRGDTLYSVINGNAYTAGGRFWMREGISHEPLSDMRYLTWNPPKQEPIIPEGFTPWHGGEWTGHPSDAVELVLRNGRIIYGIDAAKEVSWKHGGMPCDIVAYKITKKYHPETVMVEVPYHYARYQATGKVTHDIYKLRATFE